MYLHGSRSKDRLWAIGGVVAVHSLLAYALLSGLRRCARRSGPVIALSWSTSSCRYPLLRRHRRRMRQASRKGEPSPPNLKAVPTPVVAPAAEDPRALAGRRRAGSFDRQREPRPGPRASPDPELARAVRAAGWAGAAPAEEAAARNGSRGQLNDSDYPHRRQACRDRGLGRGPFHDPDRRARQGLSDRKIERQRRTRRYDLPADRASLPLSSRRATRRAARSPKSRPNRTPGDLNRRQR